MKEKPVYTYTYSASENEEVKKIREKYSIQNKPKSSSKIDQLRKLDQRVHLFATMVALIFGLSGTLMLGAGLSLVLVEKYNNFTLGVIIGVVGIIIIALANPVYMVVLEKRRKQVAPKIIKLADEILKKQY